MINFLGYIIVGVISGWISGEIVYGDGFGLLGNLVVGIIGAVLGGAIIKFINKDDSKPEGLIAEIFIAILGSIVFLFVLNLF